MIKKIFLLTLLLAPLSLAFGYFASDKPIKSGPYFGVGGSFAWVNDKLRYDGTAFIPNIATRKTDTNCGFGEAFIGYGHIFDHGNMPYLTVELGFNYPSHYHNTGINNEKINAEQGFSVDLMPGMFFDDDMTILVYLRMGVGGNRFEFDNGTLKKDKNEIIFRGGGGIEHEIINNFYIRAGYTIKVLTDNLSFDLLNGAEVYKTRPLIHEAHLGFLYLVPLY